jgi:methylglutaconyl-CoA hydratase
MGERVDIEAAEGIATLRMNRPELHNALDDALILALTGALERVAADSTIRVVVLAGAGRSFSAGADLDWMRRMAANTHAENLAGAKRLAQMLRTLHDLPKPVVARVHGAAIGGGVGLAAACDIAIAAEEAVFALSEVRLGLIPAVISPYVISAIGARQARRYFLTAERFGAAEAERIGLVHRAVPAAGLDDAVSAVADALRAGGPQALAAAKRLIADVADRPVDDALVAETAQRIAGIRATDEGREGVAAFLDKRKPHWQGEG